MRLLSYIFAGREEVGALVDGQIRSLSEATMATSMLQLIRGGEENWYRCRQCLASGSLLTRDPSSVQILAPIPRPQRNVFCVGRNYLDHVKEGNLARGAGSATDSGATPAKAPEVPQFFTKATHTVIGPGADIRLDPGVTQRLDYEVELAVIIGRGGRDIAAASAMEHVFGYTIANDVTARDLQRRHDQWFKGKSLDTTLPLGPCIVTRDQISDPRALELSLSVNGQPRQRDRVQSMIFGIESIIASLSLGMTLEAGDIIATGTPAGVGFAMQPPQYLRGGDLIVARIEGIGELSNRVVEVAPG